MRSKRSAKIVPETPQRIEPAMLETLPPAITDVLAELSAESTALGKALHPKTAASLADLVRIMNAYYSNLIEGHNTRPKDIARAIEGIFDRNRDRRNLQLEAASHVRLQAKIDSMAARSAMPEPASVDFIKWLHAEFYHDVPEEMLHVRNNDSSYVMPWGNGGRTPPMTW
jgi:Fic family protein